MIVVPLDIGRTDIQEAEAEVGDRVVGGRGRGASARVGVGVGQGQRPCRLDPVEGQRVTVAVSGHELLPAPVSPPGMTTLLMVPASSVTYSRVSESSVYSATIASPA